MSSKRTKAGRQRAGCAFCNRAATNPTISPSAAVCDECDRALMRGDGIRRCEARRCEHGLVWCEHHERNEDEACDYCGNAESSEPCQECEGAGVVYAAREMAS